MFTGIVEAVGHILRIERTAEGAELTVACGDLVRGLHRGDSMAVNGVCLTVTRLKGEAFTADVMNETLRRSALSGLRPGSRVNLERAMAADGRFGGHIVSGHIDGVGRIAAIGRDGIARRYTVEAAPELLRLVVEKGSIAVDGTSLTVSAVGSGCFQVCVIPHTSGHTTLAERRVGDGVNLETDVVGKYVQRLLGKAAAGPGAAAGLTREFLAENGF